jgi:hypothetical protein
MKSAWRGIGLPPHTKHQLFKMVAMSHIRPISPAREKYGYSIYISRKKFTHELLVKK